MPGSGASDLALASSDYNLFRVQRESRKSQIAGVAGGVAERLLDPQQLIGFGDALASRRCARLDLTAADRHRQVGDHGVLRLAAAMADHRAVPTVVSQRDGVER